MKYRTLGRTGAEVSELMFGCGNVGGIMIHADYEVMRDAVKRALEVGINWFDTAAQYGRGASEENLGKILKELDAKPYLSSKVRIDPESSEDIDSQVERAIHESLERLQVDHIDLFQLHNGIDGQTTKRSLDTNSILGRLGVITALEKLRDQRLIKWIGMTALGDTGLCRRLVESGRIDTAQVYFNLINPSAGLTVPKFSLDHVNRKTTSGQDFTGIIEECRATNTGVIVIRALAAGVLATDVRHGRESAVAEDTELAEEERKAKAVFELLGDQFGNRAQTAIRYALSQAGVSTIDFAIGEIDHLEQGLAAIENDPLPPETLDDIYGLYKHDFKYL